MALVNAFGEIALDTSVQQVNTSVQDMTTVVEAIAALQDEIKSLNETMLFLLSGIIEKMPRVNGNDQASVAIEAGAVAVSSGTITTVANIAALGTRFTDGSALNMNGVQHIYNNITVSN